MENLDRIWEHFGLFLGYQVNFGKFVTEIFQFRKEFSHLRSHPGKIAISMEEYLPLPTVKFFWGMVPPGIEPGSLD